MEPSNAPNTSADLQRLLKENPLLGDEFRDKVAALLQDHGITIAPEALSRITLAMVDDSDNGDGPPPAPRPRGPF